MWHFTHLLPVLHVALLNIIFIAQLTAAIVLTVGLVVAWPNDVAWPAILSTSLCWSNVLALACTIAHRILWPNPRHRRMRYYIGFGTSFLASLPTFSAQLIRYDTVVMLFSDFKNPTTLAGVIVSLSTASLTFSAVGIPWVFFGKDEPISLPSETSTIVHQHFNHSQSSSLSKHPLRSMKSRKSLTISAPSLTTMPRQLDNMQELQLAVEKLHALRFEEAPI